MAKKPPDTLLVELTKTGFRAAATPEELVHPRIKPVKTLRYMLVGAGTVFPEVTEDRTAAYVEDAKA